VRAFEPITAVSTSRRRHIRRSRALIRDLLFGPRQLDFDPLAVPIPCRHSNPQPEEANRAAEVAALFVLRCFER
jgi:hypothetical protein